MNIEIFVAFPMTSQWRHKVGYYRRFSAIILKMTRFYVVFSSATIEQGLGKMVYTLWVYKPVIHVTTSSMKILILSKTSPYTNKAKIITDRAKNIDSYVF